MSVAPVRVQPSGLVEPNPQFTPSPPWYSEHMFPLSKHDGPDFLNWVDQEETSGHGTVQRQSIQQHVGAQKRKQENDDVVRQHNIARKRKAIVPTRLAASAITPAPSLSATGTGAVTPNTSLRELDDLAET